MYWYLYLQLCTGWFIFSKLTKIKILHIFLQYKTCLEISEILRLTIFKHSSFLYFNLILLSHPISLSLSISLSTSANIYIFLFPLENLILLSYPYLMSSTIPFLFFFWKWSWNFMCAQKRGGDSMFFFFFLEGQL